MRKTAPKGSVGFDTLWAYYISSRSSMSKTPPVTNNARSDLHDRVVSVLELIRPSIQSDGGDIELVSIANSGVVQIRFLGACVGCPSSNMTLTVGIEENLKQNVPEVTAVIAVE